VKGDKRRLAINGAMLEVIEHLAEDRGLDVPAYVHQLLREEIGRRTGREYCYTVSWQDADRNGWLISQGHHETGITRAQPGDTRHDLTMDVMNAAKVPPGAHVTFLSIEPNEL
jgi:hypothetical protein